MKDIIQAKLDTYQASTDQDEENALKEISQEIVLYALSNAEFFRVACFQGGTCLRIVHSLDRFSEDLDFVLEKPDSNFDLEPYLIRAQETLKQYGFQFEVSGSRNAHVQMRFLKDDSIKKVLAFKHHTDLKKKIKIKIEVDINPPEGALAETTYLDFPIDYSVRVHDKSSLFAGKLHALLCRDYTKGRDWYDFLWYLANSIKPNFGLLDSALAQAGPFKGQKIQTNRSWIIEQLSFRIEEIEWKKAVDDVSRFLGPHRQESLKLWSKEFFMKKLEKLGNNS